MILLALLLFLGYCICGTLDYQTQMACLGVG